YYWATLTRNLDLQLSHRGCRPSGSCEYQHHAASLRNRSDLEFRRSTWRRRRFLRFPSGAARRSANGSISIEGDGSGPVSLGVHPSQLRQIDRQISGLLPASWKRRDAKWLG